MTNRFPTWPEFCEVQRTAVASVLASGKVNYWTGNEGRQFEEEYAAYLGVRRTIALMNGTVALELPLRMFGIGAGDEVVVTPRSFMASTSCAVLLGARPVFADVDRDSGNLSAESIARVVTSRTKAMILVHLGGWPCEMDEITSLAKANGIKVIEDCAQAHGGAYRGRPVGAFGDASAFSFCQDKIITTGGEGGLFATDDEELWSRAWSFKDHGKSYEAVYARRHPPGFRWLHEAFGTNWRMTELQAVLGRIQLRRLEDWSNQRQANAKSLMEVLRSVPGLRVPEPPEHVRHAYYRFYVYVDITRLRAGWSRDRIVGEVTSLGVPCFSGSCSEIYRERAFDGTGLRPSKELPVAKELGESSIALPVHPTLRAEHMQTFAETLRVVIQRALA